MCASKRSHHETAHVGLRRDGEDPSRASLPVVDDALVAHFSDDPRARAYAAILLEAAAAGWRTHGWPGGHDPSAEPRVYVFLDRLVAHAAPAAEKARLLASLLDATDDDRVADLVADVLLAHGDAAATELLRRWEASGSPEGAGAARRLLPALARTGTPFARATLRDLDATDAHRVRLGLVAAEAIGRGLEAGRSAAGSPVRLFLAARHQGAVREEDLERADLEAIRARVAGRVGHDLQAIREAALRAVATLGLVEAAPSVRALLGHPARTTRLAAIRVAARLGDAGAVPALIERAERGEPPERIAAIEALACLEAWTAKDLLLRLANDAEDAVALAAIGALGRLGGDELETTLRRLGATGPVARRRAAARALHGGHRELRTPAKTGRLWEWRRGTDAAPAVPLSMEAALRFAFKEARPHDELELSRAIGRVVFDVSSTRRMLVELGLLRREGGTCTLTALGLAAWRVERFVRVGRFATPRGPVALPPSP